MRINCVYLTNSHIQRGMTDEVIIRISLAALLRWQAERSEVSLYIICIMAYKVSLYFIDGFKIALIMASHSNVTAQ
ncbi:hypothetical protein [Streptococcus pseudopneumoniae]|nr:hypothetical protein [Streptococcus pseudopneumoniae]